MDLRSASACALGLAAFLAGCTIMGPTTLPDNFLVFFQAGETALSPDNTAVVHRAAEAIRAKHPTQVIVAGEPKTVVAPGFDPKLADPRFEAVERALVAEGIDQKLLARAALTDIQARVGSTGNRRVEIRLFGARTN